MMERQQMVIQQSVMMQQQAATLNINDLVKLVKDGQRNGGHPFRGKWHAFCDQGWGGLRNYDPGAQPPEALVQFTSIAAMEYGQEPWFRKFFSDLPDLPPMPEMPKGAPPMPGGPPGMPPPPGMMGPPGMPPMPRGMPPFGMPGMPPMMPPPGMGPPGMPPMS